MYSVLTKKKVSAHIYVTDELTEDAQQQIKTELDNLSNSLHKYFIAPSFDISFAPCRTENAFSTSKGGHITMCSELISDMLANNNQGAFISIFAHELGHSLLNLWGDPSYANEQTADEFAVAMLLMDNSGNGETYLYDWIDWFKRHEYLNGELSAMLAGDPHPLTVQRISNIEKILASRGDFQRRWANALYPHMTDKALSDIVDKPYAGANVALAENILKTRENSTNKNAPAK